MTLRSKLEEGSDEYDAVLVTRPTDDPSLHLPAYTPTQQQGQTVVEAGDESRSLAATTTTTHLPTYMTAEQEKAYLHGQEGSGNEKSERIQSDPDHDRSVQGLEEARQQDTTNPSSPSRGLQIPTRNRLVSSGFPYPSEYLSSYNNNNDGISADDWKAFTSDITRAARLSGKDWTVTLGAGLATLVVSVAFIGCVGVVPAWFLCRQMRVSAEMRNVQSARGSTGTGTGTGVSDLEDKLATWNRTTFAPRGFLVRLDLPRDGTDDGFDVYSSNGWRGKLCCGDGGRGRYAPATPPDPHGQGRWATRKAIKKANREKKKLVRRARIVIVPLYTAFSTDSRSTDLPLKAGDDAVVTQGSLPLSEKDPAWLSNV